MTEITHKNCSKCGLYLHRDKFYADNKRPDGLRCACKKCEKKKNRKLARRSLDKMRFNATY